MRGAHRVDADRIDRAVHADPAGKPQHRVDRILLGEVDRLRACAHAMSSRDAMRSIANTRPAPISFALAIANWPTGPAPNTATVSPGLISASWAPK
jgi:hypothetical protein